MLTKEQLAHYEIAARLYCQRIGEDPETRVPVPHPTIHGTMDLSGRVWHLAAEKLHDLSMMLTSLRDAAAKKEALRYTEEQRRLLDDIEREGLYNVLNAALYAGNRARVDVMKEAIKRGLSAPSETGRTRCLRCGADWNSGQLPDAPKRCRCGKEFDPERFCPESPVGAPCQR